MAPDYGQLKGIVAIAGSLIAAGAAIRLAWMRRAKWMPPAETVPAGTAKVSALLCSAVVGILFLAKFQIGLRSMITISLVCLVLTLIALCVSTYTNTTYSFTRRSRSPKGVHEARVLGGYKLTEEALEISRKKRMGHQQLFENANCNPDLVWTRESQALVQIASTMGFVLLQASGSVALASVAIAFDLTAAS